MSQDQEDACALWKFWNTPELIEKLLPYLDTNSTKCLAEAHDLTQETLQRDSVWHKLVRRTFPPFTDPWGGVNLWHEGELEKEVLLPSKRLKARALAELLKMANYPKSFQLDLLHVICEEFPPDEDNVDLCPVGDQYVQLTCSCNQTHYVAHLGFLLLEEVEATLGSREQLVEVVQGRLYLEPMFTALIDRAKRQQDLKEMTVLTNIVKCDSKKTVETFFNLTQHSRHLCFLLLIIDGEMDREDWGMLRKAAELTDRRDPDQWPIDHLVNGFPRSGPSISIYSGAMAGGRREDLRAIWDAFQDDGDIWTVGFGEGNYMVYEDFFLGLGEEEWRRMAQRLDHDLAEKRKKQWLDLEEQQEKQRLVLVEKQEKEMLDLVQEQEKQRLELIEKQEKQLFHLAEEK